MSCQLFKTRGEFIFHIKFFPWFLIEKLCKTKQRAHLHLTFSAMMSQRNSSTINGPKAHPCGMLQLICLMPFLFPRDIFQRNSIEINRVLSKIERQYHTSVLDFFDNILFIHMTDNDKQ